ncbi:MAG TPA: hypothetical protein VGS07_26915 [Thermoanaerobaculia bacterium]|nr:hypothetical protein [Thermoanaerobaculia bacterium]
MEHPWEETLKRFVTGTAVREERLAIVAHLLKGCPACARKIRLLMLPDPVCQQSYDSALNRFDQGLVEGLESSISPVQTLRTVLAQLLEADGAPQAGGGKPRRRGRIVP